MTDGTRNILGKENIAKCKDGVRIINCARGGLIDEAALKEAIESGKVAGAALDVYEVEPAKENVLFGMEEVVCTPHLGASTTEAQENVALQVAEQMSEYLTTGGITNALNSPSVSAEDAAKLKPYIELSEGLGAFAGQLTETGLKKITIEYEGQVAKLNTKPLTAVLLRGVLAAMTEGVNMVNAPVIAKERNIAVAETKHDRPGDYQTLIRLTVETDRRERTVSGTLFNGTRPRIVDVNGIVLEAGVADHMLYVNNDDKPGLIGNVGKLLADAGINIANFHLGRNAEGTDAIALIEVDQAAGDDVLKALESLESVKQVKILSL